MSNMTKWVKNEVRQATLTEYCFAPKNLYNKL